ncbi:MULTISPECIES: FecCD family ABC transporter permease [Rhizobium]|uniref:Iron ABC transporter permease n=1 Tax=Rhizobium sophoriradicis TaxID=1535245 RepID=A0A2A5KQ88_9HYPH|nr:MULTISPECIES: iron ABC transporter permease [Rhizobium]PCK79121.1 iron ABC transporter permease [Rhizobium sophoriradicis]UWU37256.1 iron ABC transporter permease [Rhizobium leguminosarum bv. phaseoli]
MTVTARNAEAIGAHRLRERRRWRSLLIFVALMVVCLVLDIATGPSLLSPVEVVRSLTGLGERAAMTDAIVRGLRLPMALMALAVGAALGAGGAQMQTLLNNPMASPYTLGMAAAAGFGAALVLALGDFGLDAMIAVPLGAFVFSMLAALFLFTLASMRRMTAETIILGGIALLFLFQSLLSLIQFLSSPELSQQILFWLFGSLTKATWPTLGLTAAVTLVCCAMLMADSWKLAALRMGEMRAASLGVNVRLLRMKVLVIVAVMTATATSFVGVIGFIGLVAPHIARMTVGEDQRFFLPMSVVSGALMLSAASVVSKSIIPGALFPVGIVTAIVGVPFLLWLIFAPKRSGA